MIEPFLQTVIIFQCLWANNAKSPMVEITVTDFKYYLSDRTYIAAMETVPYSLMLTKLWWIVSDKYH